MAKASKKASIKGSKKTEPKAKIGKARKAAADKPEPKVSAATVARKVIGEQKLKALLRACASLAKESSSINGSLREKIGYAVEHDHLNKSVFGLIRKLDRMEPEALSVWLDDFEHQLDVSGLVDRANSVQSLPLSNGGPEEADADDGQTDIEDAAKDAGDKVSRPQFGVGSGHKAQAPGGPVQMLPDAADEAVKH